jgi:hypothetical protein
MLRAVQQTVRVGKGGKIELLAPECPEGTDVQVIVLLANPTFPNTERLYNQLTKQNDELAEMERLQSSLAKIQSRVRKYVPEGQSLVDELIAERRAEANRE